MWCSVSMNVVTPHSDAVIDTNAFHTIRITKFART